MGMRIVAIDGPDGGATDRAAALAAATGMTVYEAARHLAAGGPRVLATYADAQVAAEAAAALAAAGFTPIVLDEDAARRERFLVRGFELVGRALAVADRQGVRLAVPFDRIAALVRGVRTLGADEREPFLDVHAADAPVLAFCERHLRYDGLHLERQPTAAANFARLVERLREQTPNARYDDRLNTRAGQLHLLGERLSPEAHLEIATLLLARTLERVAPAA